jgi:hypothetical protein
MAQTIVNNEYIQGTTVTLTTTNPFTAVDGTVIDPDVVLFGFQVDGVSDQTYTFTYTFGTGDPTNTIVRTGIGLYNASIDTSAYPTGVWVYSIGCEPNDMVNQDYTKTKVRKEGQLVVNPASFQMG